MAADWRIRAARVEDLPQLAPVEAAADSLFTQHFGAVDWPGPETGQARAAERGFLLVAVIGGDVVGFVHVLTPGEAVHLEQLSVRPEAGRQGIGSALVRAAMREAAARGFRQLTLRTFADVAWNAPFYVRFGFVVTEPRTPFELALVATENRLGLTQLGGRVQMTASLDGTT